MESIPMSVDELKELAELLTLTHHALAAYTRSTWDGSATWDGRTAALYQRTDAKAKELEALAKRYEDRYTASLTG